MSRSIDMSKVSNSAAATRLRLSVSIRGEADVARGFEVVRIDRGHFGTSSSMG
jgi:hypothetical protein